MSELIHKMHVQIKKTSTNLFTLSVRIFVGTVLGLTMALVVLELLGKKEADNMLSFLLMIVTVLGLFLKVSSRWNLSGVMIFSLISVLVGLVLRLYIMVAPGM